MATAVLWAICGFLLAGIGTILMARGGPLSYGLKQLAHVLGHGLSIMVAGFIFYHAWVSFLGLQDVFIETPRSELFTPIYLASFMLACSSTIFYMIYLMMTGQTRTWGSPIGSQG